MIRAGSYDEHPTLSPRRSHVDREIRRSGPVRALVRRTSQYVAASIAQRLPNQTVRSVQSVRTTDFPVRRRGHRTKTAKLNSPVRPERSYDGLPSPSPRPSHEDRPTRQSDPSRALVRRTSQSVASLFRRRTRKSVVQPDSRLQTPVYLRMMRSGTPSFRSSPSCAFFAASDSGLPVTSTYQNGANRFSPAASFLAISTKTPRSVS